MEHLPIAPADANLLESPAHNENVTDPRLQRGGNHFNFLRLLLATVVILSHSFQLIDGNLSREPFIVLFGTTTLGGTAVYGFFLLSGFLIVRSWQQEPRLWPFLKKRVLRIYPGFIVAFLISVFVVGALCTTLPNYFSAVNYPKTLLEIATLQSPKIQYLKVFVGQPYPEINASMWTIIYEFTCYIFVAIMGLLGVIRKQWLWLILTIALLLFYASEPNLADTRFRGERVFNFIISDKFELLCLTSVFFVGGSFFLFLPKIRFSKWLALLAFVLLIPSMILFSSVFVRIALAILGGYLLFWFAFLKIPLLDRFKYYPDVSYGLYLYGWPMQKLLILYFPAITPCALFPIALIFAYACGYFSWQLIEKPALQLKRRFPRDQRFISA